MPAHRGAETPGDFLCAHQQPIERLGIAGGGRADEVRVLVLHRVRRTLLVNRIHPLAFGDTPAATRLCHHSLFHESLSER